jgi:xanthine phosphoribosyltransferase
MPQQYYTLSWDQFHQDARALALRLIDCGPFRGIVAITRGGLIPAAILAQELQVRLVETVSVLAYGRGEAKWTELGKPEIIKRPLAAGNGEGFLLVDDLVDTGTTARAVRAMLPKAHFATVYAKPAGKALVEAFITEVSQDAWIVFPWDTEPTLGRPRRLRKRTE